MPRRFPARSEKEKSMKNYRTAAWTTILALLTWLPTAHGAPSPRGIPQENSSIVVDGRQFFSEIPIQENAPLLCHGDCVVQGVDFQIVAHDKTEFSLARAENGWTLTIRAGRIDYALRENALLTFECPGGPYRCEEIIPAYAGGVVRGTVAVTSDGTVFTGSSGQLLLAGPAGLQFVRGTAGGVLPPLPAAAIGVPAAVVGTAVGLTVEGKEGKSPK